MTHVIIWLESDNFVLKIKGVIQGDIEGPYGEIPRFGLIHVFVRLALERSNKMIG